MSGESEGVLLRVQYNSSGLAILPDHMAVLYCHTAVQYAWPGNEEELRVTVERAAAQALSQHATATGTTPPAGAPMSNVNNKGNPQSHQVPVKAHNT